MKTITKTILIIIICNIILLSAIWLRIPNESSIKDVKCYDQHGNEMVGQICHKNIEGMNYTAKVIISILILIASLLIIYIAHIIIKSPDWF